MEIQEIKALIKKMVREVLQEERLTLYNTLFSSRNNTEDEVLALSFISKNQLKSNLLSGGYLEYADKWHCIILHQQ
jgi:hypothetical protein